MRDFTFILRLYDIKNGVKQPPKEYEVDSWVKQMAQIMQHEAAPASSVASIRDTGNTLRTLAANPTTNRFRGNAAAAADTLGIVVGTGTTALDRDDHALTTQIAEGAGAGQFNHQAMVNQFAVAITGGGGYDVISSRTFDNNSGGTITIQEAAVYVLHTSWFFMILHDLVSGGHNVLTGDSVVVEYIIRFTI